MLKIGIVGKNYCDSYISVINTLDNYKLVGVFDPSFQFKYSDTIDANLIYVSFAELLKDTDSIIFASPESIYFPLIELSIKYSKSIFLSSAHNLSYHEQTHLLKLKNEADTVFQISQPILFSDVFNEFVELSRNPVLIDYNLADNSEVKLLKKTRLGISAVLTIFKSSIRKTTVNVISVFSEVPDVIKVRLDFDNGGVAEITVSSVGESSCHSIKCYEYGSFIETDLLRGTIVGKTNSTNINIKKSFDSDVERNSITKQLNNFYSNVFNCILPTNGIDNEIATQKVIEKIKEKLRISINIC